jgi:hypothetical protein
MCREFISATTAQPLKMVESKIVLTVRLGSLTELEPPAGITPAHRNLKTSD